MKAEKIREIDNKDMATRLKEADEQMLRLKFQLSMGQTEGLKKYRELRKDRARMWTVLGKRARSEQKGAK